MAEIKQFYRIANPNGEGVWYDRSGNFTGRIHNEFNFCKNSELEMEFDETIVGYLSAAESLEDLKVWFPDEDIEQLRRFGYNIVVYEAIDYKWYEKFKHYVIHQETSNILNIL